MKKLLAIVLMLTLLCSVTPVHASEVPAVMEVTGGWLRLRAAPGYEATTLASYYTGTQVSILGIYGDWYQVRTPDGLTGYMLGDYLRDSSGMSGGGGVSPTLPPATGSRQATVVSANGAGVRLRMGPSTGYDIILVAPVGTVATILLEGDQWHYVRIGDKTGYMMSQYLSTGAVMPSTGYKARVTSNNGYGVRLRSGPGTGYDVLGLYSVGTEVTVLEYGATWCKIRVGSRTGYMMTEFITTSQAATTKIRSVSLNNTAPSVGTVLTANVNPAGATVTYRWTDGNGTLLSTASSYTVGAYDVGRRIRVTVTGTGFYAGSASSKLTTAVTYSAALTGVQISHLAPVVGQTITATAQPAGATASYAWYRSDGSCVGTGSSYRITASDVGYMIYCRATGTGNYTGQVYSSYTNAITYTASASSISGSLRLPGSATVGTTITATANLNISGPMVYYSWYVNGEEILTDGGLSLTLDASMAGKTVKVVATAISGSGYTGSISSNTCTVSAAPVGPTLLSGTVSIRSTAVVGEVIRADLNLNSASVTYAWYLDGSRISGANGDALTLNSAMVGHNVYVVVTASDSAFAGSVTSNSCHVTPPFSDPAPDYDPDPATGTDLGGYFGGGSLEQSR
ncbi:MAG: SH3 domain-containing protein [Clostridia bacterium]|nr:SH3 domain-containing protein [Clostridia bacterium]